MINSYNNSDNQYNIHYNNLNTFINWNTSYLINSGENVVETVVENVVENKHDYNNNMLVLEGYYHNFFSNIIPDLKEISNIYKNSFLHNLILLSVSSISNDLNKNGNITPLDFEEQKSNMINFLENSIKGLQLYIDYNIHLKHIDYIKTVKTECVRELNTFKNNIIIGKFYMNSHSHNQNYDNNKIKKESDNKNNYLTYINNLFNNDNYPQINFINNTTYLYVSNLYIYIRDIVNNLVFNFVNLF
jgi:hypothetical protein